MFEEGEVLIYGRDPQTFSLSSNHMLRTTGMRCRVFLPKRISVRPSRLAVRKPSIVRPRKATISPKPGMVYGNRRFYPFNAFCSLLGIAGGRTRTSTATSRP